MEIIIPLIFLIVLAGFIIALNYDNTGYDDSICNRHEHPCNRDKHQ